MNAAALRALRRWGRPARWVTLTFGALAGVLAAGAAGVRINLSASLPPGVYRTDDVGSGAVRGALVLVCLPRAVAVFANQRGYVPHGGRCLDGASPVGKIVVAVAGDMVRVTDAGVSVDGALLPCSRPLPRDQADRVMPRATNNALLIGSDSVWLYAPSARSFDSRYFGAVGRDAIVGHIHPVWTPAASVARATARRPLATHNCTALR